MLGRDAATLGEMADLRQYACPICGRESAARATNGFFPFCSQPCKLVDLGKWLDGTYRVPGPSVGPDSLGARQFQADEESDE